MRNPRIYTDLHLSVGQLVDLKGDTANYIGRVLRLPIGASVVLFDNKTGTYQGKIKEIKRNQVIIDLLYLVTKVEKPTLSVHLGQGVSRGERMSYAIQKATELGVSEITPIFTQYCEVKLPLVQREKKRQHWEKIAISACEQCGRNTIPIIHSPMLLQDWLCEVEGNLKVILSCTESKTISLTEQTYHSIALLVGPEGGFSLDEEYIAKQNGFNAWRLGPRILRTETAPIVALTVMQYLWGDLH